METGSAYYITTTGIPAKGPTGLWESITAWVFNSGGKNEEEWLEYSLGMADEESEGFIDGKVLRTLLPDEFYTLVLF